MLYRKQGFKTRPFRPSTNELTRISTWTNRKRKWQLELTVRNKQYE